MKRRWVWLLAAGLIVALVGTTATLAARNRAGSGTQSQVDPRLSLAAKDDPTGWTPPAKTLPGEPAAADGRPALLEPGKEQDAYLARLGHMVHYPLEHPNKVAVMGRIDSVTAGHIDVTEDASPILSQNDAVRGSDDYPTLGSAGQVVRATTTSGTLFRTNSGSLKGLRHGDPVVVAGDRAGGGISAELVADKDSFHANKAAALTAGSGSLEFRPVAAVATQAIGKSVQQELGGDDTTVASFDFKPLGTKGFDAVAEFSIGDPNSCPYLHVKAELWIDAHAEAHWPFKFDRAGANDFTVSSLDRPDAQTYGLHVGTVNPEDYALYSGWGAGAGLTIEVGCKEGPFGGTWTPFQKTLNLGWKNTSFNHAPLAGEKDLEIAGDDCPAFDAGVWIFSIGASVCQDLTLHPGLLRATLGASGGQPQGIAMGFGSFDSVQPQTLPNGTPDTPVRVDQLNYAPVMDAGLTFGVDVGPDSDKLAKAGNKIAKKLKRSKGHYFPFSSEERHKSQKGPFLEDGRWQNKNGKWYDREGQLLANQNIDPKDITAGNAHWVHPGQQGGTLADGRWKDRDGKWRDAQGFAKAPSEDDLKNVTRGTEHGNADGDFKPIDTAASALENLIKGKLKFDKSWQPVHIALSLDYSPSFLNIALGRSALPRPGPYTTEEAALAFVRNHWIGGQPLADVYPGFTNVPDTFFGPTWRNGATLHVIYATFEGGTGASGTSVWFFVNGNLVGSAWFLHPGAPQFADDQTVQVPYQLYNPGDATALPTGAKGDLRVHWDGTKLQIPAQLDGLGWELCHPDNGGKLSCQKQF